MSLYWECLHRENYTVNVFTCWFGTMTSSSLVDLYIPKLEVLTIIEHMKENKFNMSCSMALKNRIHYTLFLPTQIHFLIGGEHVTVQASGQNSLTP